MAQKRAAKKRSNQKGSGPAKKTASPKSAKTGAVRRKAAARKSAPAKAVEGVSKSLSDAVRDIGAMVGEGARRLTGTPAKSSRNTKAKRNADQA